MATSFPIGDTATLPGGTETSSIGTIFGHPPKTSLNLGLIRQLARGRDEAAPGEGLLRDSLDDSIKTNAEGPKRASGDSGSVEQHPLPEQIAADKYLESKKASRAKGLGIKIAKISPGGTA